MASFKKVAGGHQAQIAILGHREAKTFSTKPEAKAWAAERETEIRKQKASGIDASKTCGEAFDKYYKTVSAHKKNPEWEKRRLAAFGEWKLGDGRQVKDVPMVEMTSAVLGDYRDHRLMVDQVKGSTINREFNLVSNVFQVAKKEWKWIEESPTTGVRRPKNPPGRFRTYTQDEIDRITLASGFNEAPALLVMQRVGIAYLFAIETAMRASEILKLRPMDVTGKVARLHETKNGTARDVPLSPRAIELLGFLPKPAAADKPMFALTSSQLDAMFRKIRNAAHVDGATFHDTRHHAITQLAKRLNVLELARTVGHKDLNQLQTYYNETAENIAGKLAA